MRRSEVRRWAERVALGAEVLATYVVVRWQVRRNDLPAAVAALRAGRRFAVVDRDPRRLAAAAERLVARIPGDSRCLMRSLVVLAMLARRGVDARLVLAARPTPEFAAHAWVERDGDPLLPTRGFGDARMAEL
jgi:Transglutaminase-like superfamily